MELKKKKIHALVGDKELEGNGSVRNNKVSGLMAGGRTVPPQNPRTGPGLGDCGGQVGRWVYWVIQGDSTYKQPKTRREALNGLEEMDVKGWRVQKRGSSLVAGVRAVKEGCLGKVLARIGWI